MELAVSDQMALQWESATAFLTNEWPIPSMDSQMCQQMMFKGKTLFALAALIRTLRCM